MTQHALVHIDDTNLCQLLEQAALTTLGGATLRLEFFNAYRLGPSALLDAWLPQRAAAGGAAPHIIVAGSGPIAVNLVTEAARRWQLDHRDSPDRLRVTLIAPDAGERIAALRTRLPALGKSADLAAATADLAGRQARPARRFPFLRCQPPATGQVPGGRISRSRASNQMPATSRR